MQPWQILDCATSNDGTELVLASRGGEWVIRAGGRMLMSSRTHASEEALATVALERWSAALGRGGRGGERTKVRNVLLGGIGLGYTLRALLDRLDPDAIVVVAELVPEVARWVAGPAADLARRPLEDDRVRLQHGDVLARISEARRAFDLHPPRRGQRPVTSRPPLERGPIRRRRDSAACQGALRKGGVLAVWSAGPDNRYVQRLERAGFAAEAHAVRAGPGAGPRHTILVGVKSAR